MQVMQELCSIWALKRRKGFPGKQNVLVSDIEMSMRMAGWDRMDTGLDGGKGLWEIWEEDKSTGLRGQSVNALS